MIYGKAVKIALVAFLVLGGCLCLKYLVSAQRGKINALTMQLEDANQRMASLEATFAEIQRHNERADAAMIAAGDGERVARGEHDARVERIKEVGRADEAACDWLDSRIPDSLRNVIQDACDCSTRSHRATDGAPTAVRQTDTGEH